MRSALQPFCKIHDRWTLMTVQGDPRYSSGLKQQCHAQQRWRYGAEVLAVRAGGGGGGGGGRGPCLSKMWARGRYDSMQSSSLMDVPPPTLGATWSRNALVAHTTASTARCGSSTPCASAAALSGASPRAATGRAAGGRRLPGTCRTGRAVPSFHRQVQHGRD